MKTLALKRLFRSLTSKIEVLEIRASSGEVKESGVSHGIAPVQLQVR